MKKITTLPYIGERGTRVWKTERCDKLRACIYCEAGREYPVVCEHYVPFDKNERVEGCRLEDDRQ